MVAAALMVSLMDAMTARTQAFAIAGWFALAGVVTYVLYCTLVLFSLGRIDRGWNTAISGSVGAIVSWFLVQTRGMALIETVFG